MIGRSIEARKPIWAVAEISWEDEGGKSCRVSGTLEDTSNSGACVRVGRFIHIGSRVVIKWHREQFPAVAKNCRRDGREFLLGVMREPEIVGARVRAAQKEELAPVLPTAKVPASFATKTNSVRATVEATTESRQSAPVGGAPPAPMKSRIRPDQPKAESPLPSQERRVMSSKNFFPKFWRSQATQDSNEHASAYGGPYE